MRSEPDGGREGITSSCWVHRVKGDQDSAAGTGTGAEGPSRHSLFTGLYTGQVREHLLCVLRFGV